MTTERNPDPEATVKMPTIPSHEEDAEDFDPERTLVREDLASEDWESTVIRRVAPHVVAVHSEIAESEGEGEERFGWESEVLRRLSRELQLGRHTPES